MEEAREGVPTKEENPRMEPHSPQKPPVNGGCDLEEVANRHCPWREKERLRERGNGSGV
jgi:hypothetical protein